MRSFRNRFESPGTIRAAFTDLRCTREAVESLGRMLKINRAADAPARDALF
jgi:hypothetical protein